LTELCPIHRSESRDYGEENHSFSELRSTTRSIVDVVGKIDLDLAMLVEIGFENNPETRRMWQLVRATAAERNRTQSIFFPNVTLSSAVDWRQIKNTQLPDGKQEFHRVTFTYPSLQLSYVLFTFSGNFVNAQAAQENLLAANFSYNRSLQELLFSIQRSYFALSSAIASVEAAEENLRDATETLRLSEERLRIGLGDRQTYLQAKTGQLQSEHALAAACAEMECKRAALATAIGVRVTHDFRIIPSQLPQDLSELSGNVEEVISQAILRRPDLLAAHAKVRALQCKEKAAQRVRLPQLFLNLCGGFSEIRHGGGVDGEFATSINLSWNIFDGFAAHHKVREAHAQKRAAAEDLRREELRVAGEIWTYYHSFQCAHRRVLAAREWVTSAAESFRATELSYRNGLSSFMDLLNAQNVLATARQNRVAAENDFSVTLAGLANAAGSMEAIQ
jgi:outer membrane protein TolC